MARKIFLFLCRRPPEGHRTLEAALTAAAFHHEVHLVFTGDGVFHLMGEAASRLERALAEVDIEHLAVDGEALARRGLRPSALARPLAVLGKAELAALMAAAHLVVPQ